MRLHRFYIEQKIPYSKKTGKGEGEITLTDTELIHQLLNVFRFKAGDKIILFDETGTECEAEIMTINKKEINLNILSVSTEKIKAENNKKVSLYLSLIKKDNFEWACEKCTEIGVTEIHPIISERSEKKDLNLERLNKIAKEASEQSGRVTLPKVFEIMDLEEAVLQAVEEGRECVVFHTSTTSSSECHSSLEKAEKGEKKDVALFVGPEGGFTEKEIELFKKNNFKICSLGSNILRAETAAIVAVWNNIKNQ